jgi:transcription antitermination factor NusG
MQKRWYVVEAFEGKDCDVCLRLACAKFHVWRPVDEVRPTVRARSPRSGRLTRPIRKVARFGRYVFLRVEMSESVQWAIGQTPGVRGFVCGAGEDAPAAIADELIAFLKEHRLDRRTSKFEFSRGDIVRMSDGPFEGLRGVVEDIDKRGVLRVELELFGRSTPIIIEVGHVELVEQGRRPPIGRDVRKHSSLKRA